MSSEPSRPSCPFKHQGLPVPPRFQQGPITTALNLGPLALLTGSWHGKGFNTIWRPDNTAADPPGSQIKRFLELNLTSENLDFHVIPGVVPNRGLQPQTDLSLYGLHYLQRISDRDPHPFSTAGQALHIEPGLFMRVPGSDEASAPSIVRLASIPHGVSVLMQGADPGTTPTPGPPVIPPVYPIPGLPTVEPPMPAGTLGLGILPINVPFPPAPTSTFHAAAIEGNLALDVAGSQSNGPYNLPGQEHFQEYVNDPNSLLRHKIADQHILGHTTINLTTTNAGSSIGNIPFLGLTNPAENPDPAANLANAFVYLVNATFWIEWVHVPGAQPIIPIHGGLGHTGHGIADIEPFWEHATFLQLQYSQVVILIFNGSFWPHVTVATLTLSNG